MESFNGKLRDECVMPRSWYVVTTMPGGGSRPGERRGGRPKGSKDQKVIERETIAAEIRAGRIAAGIAMPLMATEKLEMLLLSH
jgi:hypothetical protein